MSGARRARQAATVLWWAAVGLVTVLVATAAAVSLVGWRVHAVASASMAPALVRGDAVVSVPVRPRHIRAGDVVTFREPGGDRLITHRVAHHRHAGAVVEVVTKGDAAAASEAWSVAADGRVGRVVYRLPHVGTVMLAAAAPAGRVLLLAVPAVLLAGIAVGPTSGRRPDRPVGHRRRWST